MVVRTEYLKNNPDKVKEFLTDYKASIEFLNANPADAAQMIQDTGIFAQAAVAEKAIPKCNVCYLDGSAMKSAMEVYLTALMNINANAIGGKLPAADFYYNAE